MSRLIDENDIIKMLNTMDRYTSEELTLCDTDETFPKNEVFIVDDVFEGLDELPSAQPELSEIKRDLSDLISRQDAIDAIDKALSRTFVEPCGEMILKDVPSAQAEIIHCGECKHRDPEDKKCDCGHDILWQLPRDDKWYCADAERRTDG